MAVPSQYNTDFAFQSLASVADVQAIMDALLTMLTSTLSSNPTQAFPTTQQWSVVSGTTYKSPVDARGRYMTVALTRTTIGRLRFVFSDPSGVLYDGEIQISGTGVVNLYAGPGHIFVESNNGGTWEVARAFITDPTPEALDSGVSYVWCIAHRSNTGALTSNANLPEYWCGRYTGGAVFPGNPSQGNQIGGRPLMPGSDDGNTHIQTEAGSDVAMPVGIGISSSNANLGADNFNAGKMYQACWVDNSNSQGSVLAIPIDAGVTGNFKVTGLDASGGVRLAVRKP